MSLISKCICLGWKEVVNLVSLKEVKHNPIFSAYIKRASLNMEAMGYTEHGLRHVGLVSSIAENVLLRLGYPKREAELAAIAGYLHDCGNAISRQNHGQSSALLVSPILIEMGMDFDEVSIIASALGNHEEEYGYPVNNISAAVILADKSDVHRTRVKNENVETFGIHDRVSYAAVKSFLDVNKETSLITLFLTIETEICPVMEYFEIFMTRMIMCRKAANVLGCSFKLEINGASLL